jgi:hypothetical protein
MRRAAVVTCLWFLAIAAGIARAGEPKPKESVALAKSWDAAVSEAKLLNVPLVVHSHGFYCGPCWGMHSATMLNKKYIEFASENTVEVIALERLQEGVDKGERHAETYKAKENGAEMEFLVEFPGLTVAEVLALATSKAGSYNKTGKIPYTCLVNPYTEEEIKSFPGSTPSGDIMEAVLEARKALEKENGKGVARKDVRAVQQLEADALERVQKGEFATAIAEVTKVSTKGKAWPQAMQDRVSACKERVVTAAHETLAKIEATAAEDRTKAKSELTRLIAKLKGTGLEAKAKELLASLSTPPPSGA